MTKILLIGCGKMGQAILNGWVKRGIKKADIAIIDPFAEVAGFKIHREIGDFHGEPDFVVLAIKPQMADDLLPMLGRFKRAVYISIMAGKTTHHLSNKLLSMEIVRAMPNLPATIGSGYTALYAPAQVNAEKRQQVTELFEACGKVVWLQDEAQMDAITAVSGSGSAYVFLFAEAMIEAGIKLGLPAEIAKDAALQTILGGAGFAINSSDTLAELQQSVASKGGTTQAALDIFNDGSALKNIVDKAMLAAHNRSKELAE
jgi:pyrroline-5-carboxylate reductase